MDDAALQQRLATVERRQRLLLALLLGLYLLAGLWVLVTETAALTVWHAVVGVVALATVGGIVGMSRRRGRAASR